MDAHFAYRRREAPPIPPTQPISEIDQTVLLEIPTRNPAENVGAVLAARSAADTAQSVPVFDQQLILE